VNDPPIDHLGDAAAFVNEAAHALHHEDDDPRRYIRAAIECLNAALAALEQTDRISRLDDWR